MPAALAAALALLLAAVWSVQRRLVYFPAGPPPPAGQVLPQAREVELDTRDGLRLGAWFVPAGPPDTGVAVLVAAGNAGNRADRAEVARRLAAAGCSVLLFDYRGYGGNPGRPSEAGFALDARAARDHLIRRCGVTADRLLYLGESLGAAVVTELATEHPPAGLVLRSPFVSLAAVGRVHYPFLPVSALLRDRFPLAEQLARIRVPTVVVYGDADEVVPPQQSAAVATTARGPVSTVVVPGARHNDLRLVAGRDLIGATVDLADRVRAEH